jgi:hypothetical protein
MQFYFFFIVSLIVAAVHLYRDRQPRTGRRMVEVFLLWLLVINVGIGSVFRFIGHTVFADRAAASIRWPADNPFQTEVAIANLAFGTLGILCYWFRSEFWTATVFGSSVWMLGDAVGHIYQIIVAQNYSPNNAGAALSFNDIGIPLILIALLVYHRYAGGHEPRAAARVR